jgi:ABC-type amino acid transport substrate-binding protein
MWMMISFMLIVVGCGKKEGDVPSAAQSMEKHKKVIILTNPVNAPFEYGAGTSVQGLGVDIGNEIAKALNIEVKWIPVKQGYDHTFELLAKGEAEILVSSAVSDPEKAKSFDFSKPYYETGDVIAVQRNTSEINSLPSLSGKKVGVCSGRPGDKFMSTQKTATNVTLTKYSSLDDALGALNRTEIDAVVGDEPIVAYSIYKSFNNTTLVPNRINNYKYVVAVRKGETELLQKINETIGSMQSSGQSQKAKDQWVGDIVDQAINIGKQDKKIKDLMNAPKTISVTLNKQSGAWKMDSLDGFQLKLQGPNGSYQSAGILTEGNRGNCRFTTPVPPGEYSLQMPISRQPTKVQVPDLAQTSLAMTMDISGGTISIRFR